MPPKKKAPTLSNLFNAARRDVGHGFRIGGSPGRTSSHGHTHHHNNGRHSSSGTSPSGSSNPSCSPDLGVSDLLKEIRKRLLVQSTGNAFPGNDSFSLESHRLRAMEIAFGRDPSRKNTPKKGSSAHESYTQDDDDGVCTSSVEFSLICPYSLQAMAVPVRSKDCHHIQCCDLNSWMVLLDKMRSLRDPSGPCPVCKNRVSASTLEVDLWVQEVARQLPAGTHLVLLEQDGSYRSADSDREKRKEMMTEIVDATQDEYINYFGEVVEDDESVQPSAQLSAVPFSQQYNPILLDEEELFPSKRPRDDDFSSFLTGPATTDASVVAVSPATEVMSTALRHNNTPSVVEDSSMAPSTVRVKKELNHKDMPPPSSPHPTTQSSDDDGVTIVHYVPPRGSERPLPSQLRLWELHCPTCGAVILKNESGSLLQCSYCAPSSSGKGLTPADLVLVRRFEQNPSVTLELLPDGTSLLNGMDEAAPYLTRAGYLRSPFAPSDWASPSTQSAVEKLFAPRGTRARKKSTDYKGVWVSTVTLNRFDIDFLEACCQRVANGEDLTNLSYQLVPPRFRIPRRRTVGGGSATQGNVYGGSVASTQIPHRAPLSTASQAVMSNDG